VRTRTLLVGLLAASVASALSSGGAGAEGGPPRFRFERPVIPGGTGPNRLEPDVVLLGGAVPLAYEPASQAGEPGRYRGGLADLRLFDAAGREVPYLLMAPPSQAPEWRSGQLLPIAATKTESGFEVDLGAAPRMMDRVRFTGLPAPFLKRFRLEGSGDRSRWTLLVPEGTLFDLPEERLRRLDVDFPAGDFRYLRLTWDDRSSARAPLPLQVEARLAQAALSSVQAGLPARYPVPFTRRPSEPGKSRFRLHLPAARLPVVALVLDVPGGPGGALLRPAIVTEGRLTAESASGTSGIAPVRLGAATLRRAVRDGLSASDLRIPLALLPDGPDLELTVDDGNNPPLLVAGVTAEIAPLPWIYFEAGSTAPLTARFGDREATAPRYDLETLRDPAARARTAPARWGDVKTLGPQKASAASPMPALGAPVDPGGFRYRRKLPPGPPELTALLLDATILSRSPDLADLRIADAQGLQVPYLLERRDEPLSLTLPALARKAKKGDPPSVSRYPVELPEPSLPAARLVLATTARVFEREVRVVEIREAAGRARERPGEEPGERIVASATWRHADPETPAPELTLELPSSPATRFDLRVEEGDNAPLPLEPPRLLLPAHRLRFFYPATPPLTLLYGQPGLPPPRYDLSLLAPRLLGESAKEMTLSPEPRQRPEPGAADTERRIFWAALVGTVLVLLLLLGRLLRATPNHPPG
jgi:hypothetical protein